MKNYVYGVKSNRRFAIKGTLSADGKTISYVNSDKEEAEIALDKCFSAFRGMPIEVSITTKTEQDLAKGFEEDN